IGAGVEPNDGPFAVPVRILAVIENDVAAALDFTPLRELELAVAAHGRVAYPVLAHHLTGYGAFLEAGLTALKVRRKLLQQAGALAVGRAGERGYRAVGLHQAAAAGIFALNL